MLTASSEGISGKKAELAQHWITNSFSSLRLRNIRVFCYVHSRLTLTAPLKWTTSHTNNAPLPATAETVIQQMPGGMRITSRRQPIGSWLGDEWVWLIYQSAYIRCNPPRLRNENIHQVNRCMLSKWLITGLLSKTIGTELADA